MNTSEKTNLSQIIDVLRNETFETVEACKFLIDKLLNYNLPDKDESLSPEDLGFYKKFQEGNYYIDKYIDGGFFFDLDTTHYHASIQEIYFSHKNLMPYVIIVRADRKTKEPFIEIGPPVQGEKVGFSWRKINPDKTVSEAFVKDISEAPQNIQDAFFDYVSGRTATVSGKMTTEKVTTTPYPISKIDRATSQNLLPIMMNKGIFSGYKNLPTYDSIIEKEKDRLSKGELTFQERRSVLSQAKRYIHQGYVMTDYGAYSIGFKAELYTEILNKSEIEFKNKLKQPSIFPEDDEAIEKVLKRIRLWKLAHRLSMLILSEAYQQKEYKNLVMTKESILKYLGYSSEDKQIYQDITDALFSLKWCDYIYYDYEFTDKKKVPKKETGTATGVFLYNLVEDPKQYTLSINEKFVGCINMLTGPKIQDKKERKNFFTRGYYSYPTRALPLSKEYSTPAYLLQDFLIRDSGNRHYNEKNHKVVVYKLDKFMQEAGIRNIRLSDAYPELISAFSEVDIITKTEPSISELRKMKPSQGIKTQVKVWIPTPVRKLDSRMKEILDTKKK